MSNDPCPFCRSELQTIFLTDIQTGLITDATLDCLNPECPRDELTEEELQSLWDQWKQNG